MQTVIYSAPQGAGKTRRAEALRKWFGCNSIVDEWTPGPHSVIHFGGLHLTNHGGTELDAYRSLPHLRVVEVQSIDVPPEDEKALKRTRQHRHAEVLMAMAYGEQVEGASDSSCWKAANARFNPLSALGAAWRVKPKARSNEPQTLNINGETCPAPLRGCGLAAAANTSVIVLSGGEQRQIASFHHASVDDSIAHFRALVLASTPKEKQ